MCNAISATVYRVHRRLGKRLRPSTAPAAGVTVASNVPLVGLHICLEPLHAPAVASDLCLVRPDLRAAGMIHSIGGQPLLVDQKLLLFLLQTCFVLLQVSLVVLYISLGGPVPERSQHQPDSQDQMRFSSHRSRSPVNDSFLPKR